MFLHSRRKFHSKAGIFIILGFIYSKVNYHIFILTSYLLKSEKDFKKSKCKLLTAKKFQCYD